MNTVEAYADHDIAYLLFYKAKMDQDKNFLHWVKILYRYPSLTSHLISDYPIAWVDRDDLSDAQKELLFAQEALAECWTSEKNTSSHSRLHQKIAMMLDNRLKQPYIKPEGES